MSNKTVAGFLLPSGGGRFPEPVLVSGLDDLNRMVGGLIDAVTRECEGDSPDSTPFVAVGYINDEGILLGLEQNYFASSLFGRPLFGDVVLVSGTNPETGDYDGENHDIPSDFANFIVGPFQDDVIKRALFSLVLAETLANAVADGWLLESEVDDFMDMLERTDPTEEGAQEMMALSLAALIGKAADNKTVAEEVPAGVAAIEAFLAGSSPTE